MTSACVGYGRIVRPIAPRPSLAVMASVASWIMFPAFEATTVTPKNLVGFAT
jgi:hypothetical protein